MPLNLQDVLDAAQDAESPEARATAIKALLSEGDPAPTRDEVNALCDEAVEKFGTLNEADPSDAESLLGLELLADVATAARETQVAMDQADAENKARREELAAKVAGTEETAPDDEGDKPTEETAPAGEAKTDADSDTDSDAGAQAPAAVAAAGGKPGRRFNLANIKAPEKTAPQAKDTADSSPTLSITAAADVRGFAGGQDLDGMDGLVAAAMAKIGAMPNGVDGVHVRAGFAQIKVPYPAELVASGTSDDTAVVEHAAQQGRLTGGSLAAAGGWCSPSETLYDLAPLLADANAGLIDVPDISVKRGGIKTAAEADFATIWAGAVGQIQTETQAIAGTDKTLYRVPCTTFTETRLDVIYTGIVAGILQNDAYPELTRQYVEGALTAHAHKVNLSTIARMVTAAGTEVDLSTTVGPSAVGGLLNGLELQITHLRYQYRAPESMTLEVILPIWAKASLRSDFALRGGVPFEQVTDAQITAWFTARGARVQWVYDWQDAYSGVAAGYGKDSAMTQFPTTVNALVYPSGTFVRGRGEVVNLEAVYDSTNIIKNDFLRLFVEEKLLVHKRQYKAVNVKFGIGVRGAAAAGQVLDHGGIPTATP